MLVANSIAVGYLACFFPCLKFYPERQVHDEFCISGVFRHRFGLQGTRTSELHLSNLEAGQYKFRLTVADESGQEDSADVMVNVQPVGDAVCYILYVAYFLHNLAGCLWQLCWKGACD